MRCVDGYTHQRSGGTDTGGGMEIEQAVNSMCVSNVTTLTKFAITPFTRRPTQDRGPFHVVFVGRTSVSLVP